MRTTSRGKLAFAHLVILTVLAACGNPSTAPSARASTTAPTASPAIAVTDLGPSMLPNAVNASGTIVGSANGRATLWSHGAATDLGTLGGAYSAANAINANGTVVGMSLTASGEQHAFRWERGVMTDLGTLGGGYSVGVAVDPSGRVVGSSRTAAGAEHAFLWDSGVMRDLGTLGGSNSYAKDISASGDVVGWSEVLDPYEGGHAFLWRQGVMTDIAVGPQSEADAINAAGLIAGQDFDVAHPGSYRLMFWRGTSATFSGYENDHLLVEDLALDGSVVGVAAGAPYLDGPFLWKDGTTTILPPPDGANPPEFGDAVGIDPKGHFIVGWVQAGISLHGVLWTVSRGGNELAARP